MRHILKRHHISFSNAFNGLFWALKTQPNFRVHFLISGIVIVLGIYLKILYYEWLIVIVLLILGLVIETINTAIEATTDSISTEWRSDIKIAKDVSAAAMLIFSFGSIIVAGFIFIPKLQIIFQF